MMKGTKDTAPGTVNSISAKKELNVMEKPTIFISWSKPLSNKIAGSIKCCLETIFCDYIEAYFSEKDLESGILMQNINSAMRRSEIGIICLTRENLSRPWLAYELGFMSGLRIRVYPIMFGIDQTQIQNTLFAPLTVYDFENGLREVIRKVYEKLPYSSLLGTHFNNVFERALQDCFESIRNIIDNSEAETDIGGLSALLSENDFGSPMQGTTLEYQMGYETQQMYVVLSKAAKKRFWIIGRKNQKLLQADCRDFWEQTITRENFDFRCIFFDPNLDTIAQDIPNFRESLKLNIKNACEKLNIVGIDPKAVLKYDATDIETGIIVVDDVVIFRKIERDEDGMPKHLTGRPFQITAANNEIGKRYLG